MKNRHKELKQRAIAINIRKATMFRWTFKIMYMESYFKMYIFCSLTNAVLLLYRSLFRFQFTSRVFLSVQHLMVFGWFMMRMMTTTMLMLLMILIMCVQHSRGNSPHPVIGFAWNIFQLLEAFCFKKLKRNAFFADEKNVIFCCWGFFWQFWLWKCLFTQLYQLWQ